MTQAEAQRQVKAITEEIDNIRFHDKLFFFVLGMISALIIIGLAHIIL